VHVLIDQTIFCWIVSAAIRQDRIRSIALKMDACLVILVNYFRNPVITQLYRCKCMSLFDRYDSVTSEVAVMMHSFHSVPMIIMNNVS
jgi:hypothetical protein